MTQSKRKKNILHVSPQEDQGSEAKAGFDFQDHCICRLCLEMARNQKSTAIISEYHEDLTILYESQPPAFLSIKKRESTDTWSIALIKDAVIKLFQKLEYKNVGELIIYGHGRPSKAGDFSLYDLITLLECPPEDRDEDWTTNIASFADHIKSQFTPKFSLDTVKQGLALLHVRLTMPHPDAIESENVMLSIDTIQEIWKVAVAAPVGKKSYKELFDQVQRVSKRPQKSRTEKIVTRDRVIAILRGVLKEEKILAEDYQMVLDMYTKLQKVSLQQSLPYALERRMDAWEAKFALDIGTLEWQDLKDEIATEWEQFHQANLGLKGRVLQKELRKLLRRVSDRWAAERNNHVLGPNFAEGLFFDMLAVCEADFGA
jgi:hypothetical protein